MLTAYRVYNYASCGAMASVIYLCLAAAHMGIDVNNSIVLFYAWGVVSILMVFVSAWCKFNKLPACLHTVLLLLVPAAAQFLPGLDSAVTLYSRLIVGTLVASSFLLLLFYFCGKSTDGKGDFIMQGLEDLFLNPWSISLMAMGLLPAGFMLGIMMLLSEFRID